MKTVLPVKGIDLMIRMGPHYIRMRAHSYMRQKQNTRVTKTMEIVSILDRPMLSGGSPLRRSGLRARSFHPA
jgi:hypothetical protein